MEKQLARPYYQDTGRRPYLYYAVKIGRASCRERVYVLV